MSLNITSNPLDFSVAVVYISILCTMFILVCGCICILRINEGKMNMLKCNRSKTKIVDNPSIDNSIVIEIIS